MCSKTPSDYFRRVPVLYLKYLCKSIFYFTAPRISILSESAKHVEHQSALNLTCVVDAVASQASQSGGQKWPKMVWYKDGKVSKNTAHSDLVS